jgi:RimJ/RimL family protein N-acetyltransferase
MVILREIAREDLISINRWRQDSDLMAGLGAPARYINEEVEHAWFDDYLRRRGTDVRCAIVLADRPSLVGLVSLTGIDQVHRRAEFHLLVGERVVHGRGIGTIATTQMLSHAFRDLNLHRVFLSVIAYNRAAIRVYEKVGFRREGVAREAAFKRGRYEDMLAMGILKSEFADFYS